MFHPWVDLGGKSKAQNSSFSENGHVAYQIKEDHEYSSMVANIFPADPYPPDPGVGINRSEHGHAVYQIKGNQEMQQHGSNILTADPPPRPLGSKSQTNQLFQNNNMLNINLKGITCTATWSQIFCLGMGSIGRNSIFQNVVLLHIKLKGIAKCSNMVANILHAAPPRP